MPIRAISSLAAIAVLLACSAAGSGESSAAGDASPAGAAPPAATPPTAAPPACTPPTCADAGAAPLPVREPAWIWRSGTPCSTPWRSTGSATENRRRWRAGPSPAGETFVDVVSRGLVQECTSPRFTPDGGIVCGGGSAVVKLDLDGRVLWTRALERDGATAQVKAIALDGRGTILVAGSHPETIGSGFLAALDADGAVRFIREVVPAPIALAADAQGRAALLVADPLSSYDSLRGTEKVLLASPAGELLWRTAVPDAWRIAFAGDRVVVAMALAEGEHVVGGRTLRLDSRDVVVVAFDR